MSLMYSLWHFNTDIIHRRGAPVSGECDTHSASSNTYAFVYLRDNIDTNKIIIHS